MKTRIVLIVCLLGCGLWLRAQDPVPNLIISEIYMYHTEEAYVEITNTGDQPADLSRVIFSVATNNSDWETDTTDNAQFLTNAPLLPPGESFVVINERTNTTDTTILYTLPWYYHKADYILYYTQRGSHSGMRFVHGDDAFGLFYDRDGDNNLSISADTLLDMVGEPDNKVTFDVAGITNASVTHTLIRKTTVTKGNANFEQWDKSRGVDAEDSDWIPIPYDPYTTGGAMFTTVGNHGNDFTWNFSPKSGTVEENSITIPWGSTRSAIYRDIEVGPNMAWYLRWGLDTLGTTAVQTGDTLMVYLCGDEMELRKYTINIAEPLDSNNIVIPRLDRNPDISVWTAAYVEAPTEFRVTMDDPVIDTIYEVPFGTRIDTLLAYFDKAANATWELQTSDGSLRADLNLGDKLVVTAANGNEKEYFVKVDDYAPSNNAYLSTILLDNDTLWGFTERNNVYNVTLSPDARSFPSISVTTANTNATAKIKHPTYIRGSEDDRTAFITVVAESDTVEFDYKIIFDYPRAIEVNRLEPFFSQFICGTNIDRNGIEIFNPSNVPISLIDYMMVRARPGGGSNIGSLDDAISEQDSSDWKYRLNFGLQFDQEKRDLGVYFKEATNYIIDIDPYDVFFTKRDRTTDWGPLNEVNFFMLKNDWMDPDYGYGFIDGSMCYLWTGYNFWLLKMTNDSIISGLKSGDDPDDWEFIDIFGSVSDDFDHTTITIDGNEVDFVANQHYIRKGHITKGNTVEYGSLKDGEWYMVEGENYYRPVNDVGRHAHFIKPTYFKSTVTSSTYLVSNGKGDNETIKGVFPGSTVSGFYEKIVKADSNQVLKVMAGDGTGERELSAGIVTGDTLVVQSADFENTTRYAITTSFLSPNATLSSDLYNIEVSGTTGTIDSIAPLTTINELLDHLTLPDGAFMNIFDNRRRHIPVLHYAPDTLIPIDPVVNDSIFIEVIAQDGATKILYSLIMKESREPYLTSNVYYIYQDLKVIDLFQDLTNINTFLYNVTPSSGASIMIFDKYDYERIEGDMYIDDKIMVTNDIDTVIYTLHGFYDTTAVADTTATSVGPGITGENYPMKHTVYPNPATEILNVAGLETGSKIAVINMLGEIVEIREAWSNSMQINLNGYKKGVYFIRIMKNRDIAIYKFIIQ